MCRSVPVLMSLHGDWRTVLVINCTSITVGVIIELLHLLSFDLTRLDLGHPAKSKVELIRYVLLFKEKAERI